MGEAPAMEALSSYAWLDDRIVSGDELRVSGDDPGFLIGDGIFETMRVRDGQVVALAAHLARFERSREALALPTPATDPAAAIAAVLAATDPGSLVAAGMRLTLSARPTLIVRLRTLTARDLARRAGLALHTLPERRGESFVARHKTLAWNANAIQQRLHADGADLRFEGLWLDPDGIVLEGTTTNLFAIIDGVVLTAPTSLAILPGIARAQTLAALSGLAIPHREAAFTRADLDRADAIFATNALLPLAPVLTLDGVAIGAAQKQKRPSDVREPLHSLLLRALY